MSNGAGMPGISGDSLPKGKGIRDVFSNKAITSLTMTAANTLSNERIDLNINSQVDMLGVVIERLEYSFPKATIIELATNADQIQLALAISATLTAIVDVTQSAILDSLQLMCAVGAGAPTEIMQNPQIHNYTDLKGGGIITSGEKLYLYMNTGGFAAAGTVYFTMYYHLISLDDKTARELLGILLPANI